MKNLFTALALVAAVSFVACGPSQEEIDKANKRKQDSIDSVNAAMAAEEAARMEAEQKMKDSIAAAENAKRIADSLHEDSVKRKLIKKK
ncbi:MAG: hypothetical protein AB1458_12570 [Bacteroidota bacterium]